MDCAAAGMFDEDRAGHLAVNLEVHLNSKLDQRLDQLIEHSH